MSSPHPVAGNHVSERHSKFVALRNEYPFMEYNGFDTTVNDKGLEVVYHFNLADKYRFTPSFTIPRRPFYKNFPTEYELAGERFQSLLFHIGLIELISYWKTACPPLVIVKPYALSAEQVSWWKNVYYQGLGEFFYTNGIQTDAESFMDITSGKENLSPFKIKLDDNVIVPIGGGKDSVVTLELLKQATEIRPFILNPRGATIDCAQAAGFPLEEVIRVNRNLDNLILELNRQGFLNGHTPFSAMLAFYCLLVATLTGHKHIALSNESSANEPTVAGSTVNHQYSKSYEFENDFRVYVNKYISTSYNYFSFLRPLNELQIAKLFAEQIKYYPVFKSCNVGSKTDTWCCNCPKCLFAFTILSPFIPMIELTHIFGKNLFETPQMIPFLKELIGIEDVKPFECVGTIEDVNAALLLYMEQNKYNRMPLLLDYYTNTSQAKSNRIENAHALLKYWNKEHFVPETIAKLLEQKVK